MAEVVFWTFCGQWCFYNIGAEEHSTTTHIRRAVLLDNQLVGNFPADTTGSSSPLSGALPQSGPANSASVGVNPIASISSDLGGDPDIGQNSVYDVGSLRLTSHFFIGGAITSETKPPTSDDVDVGAPDFWYEDIFFGDEFCDKLDDDAFYDAVETLHKTGTLATDATVPTSGDEDESGCNN